MGGTEGERIRLLLVEDDEDFSSALIVRFTRRNFEVTAVSTAENALDKLKNDRFDVIVADIKLPEMNGIEFLSRVREFNRYLPVVLVTGYASLESAREAVKLNAADYLLKPLENIDDLLNPIHKAVCGYRLYLENKELTDSLRAKIAELKRSERKYRDLFELASDIIYTVDPGGIITSANKRLEEITKYKKEEIIGKPDAELIVFTESGLQQKRYQKILAGKPVDMAEVRIVTRDREERLGEIGMRPIREDGRITGIQCIVRDITERKRVEEKLEKAYQELKETQQQLIQSAKMAAMGQLAAGLSHELNQPLAGIKGFAQAALRDWKGNGSLKEDLTKIIEQADRMDKIIQNVRFFARKAEFRMEKLDINSPLEDSLTLLTEQLKLHNIRIKKSLGENLPSIKGDSNQLQQTFLNLITNARDAIDSLKSPHGGELAVETSLSEDKKHIRIVFEDTGCGISGKDMEHIFNPFYTTKSPGGGIGLGLSIVFRIIENHKGKIEVKSEEGKGATFTITLPVAV